MSPQYKLKQQLRRGSPAVRYAGLLACALGAARLVGQTAAPGGSVTTQAAPVTMPAAAAVVAATRTRTPEPLRAEPVKAEQAYLAGARLLERKELAGAQTEFARAVALAPARQDYLVALLLTREHRVNELIQQAAQERLASHAGRANALLAEARRIDPENERILEHSEDMGGQVASVPAAARTQVTQKPEPSYAGPIETVPTPGLQSLHLRGDTRQVVTSAATAYGLKVVFDDSVTGQPLRFDMEDTPYGQAMPILLRMAHVFAVAVDAKTLLVAKDTEENRQKFERQVEETIYVPASTIEQLNELSNIIKNVFDVKQIAISQSSGTIVLRAPATTLKAVNYTLADMLDGGAEVLLEMKLISVDKTHTRNIGVIPPTQLNAFSAAAEAQQFVSANKAIIDAAIAQGATFKGTPIQVLLQEAAFLIFSGLATNAKLTNVLTFFGNGISLFGVSLGSGGSFNFGLNSSASQALDDISVRIGDRQTTTLRVGSKYPVTTSTFSSGISSSTAAALKGITVGGKNAQDLVNQYLGAGSAATVPMIQYEDLGITLKTTPTVMKSGLVSLHVEMKLEALTGASANNIPVLTSRAFTSDITVQDGATVVMLSDMSSTEAASVNGLPGLGTLPGFQESLDDKLKESDSSELVLLITPHLVRRRSNEMSSRRMAFNTSVPQDN